MAQKIEDLAEFKNFFAELFQIISRFVLAKKILGVRCTLRLILRLIFLSVHLICSFFTFYL